MREYAVGRPILNDYLVRQRDRRRLRELAQVLLVGLALGACLVGYVWLHVELMRTGYRVDALEDRLQEAVRQERLLLLEAEFLERPERVEQRAAAELGLVRPSPENLIFERELR